MSKVVFKSEVRFFDCDGLKAQSFDEVIEGEFFEGSGTAGFTVVNHAGVVGGGFPFVMPISTHKTLEAAISFIRANS